MQNIPAKKPWPEIILECYEEIPNYFAHPIAKAIYCGEKTHRAVILHRPDGLFQVATEKLIPFHDDELQYIGDGFQAFWSSDNQMYTGIYESAESAEAAILTIAPFADICP